MKVTIIGAGYVGLPTAGVFAKLGHHVTLLQRNEEKVKQLLAGEVSIYEPGLSELIREVISLGRFHATTSYEEAIPSADIVFICVGTPSNEAGEADLTQVFDAARTLAPHLRDFTTIVDKSTVPVGTAREVERVIRTAAPQANFAVASCPEFFSEGEAVKNAFHPDRIVIGVDDERARDFLLKAHEGLSGKRFVSDIESAEMVKYASNTFLATKISFINEIANICERVGADVEEVARGMGMDERIGGRFLKAGLGWGGSCLPKDVKALRSIAESIDYEPAILRAVQDVNRQQRCAVIEKVKRALGGLDGKLVLVLGLAFKQDTDDIRESPAIAIIGELQKSGACVRVYDPIAMERAKRQMVEAEYVEDVLNGFDGADAAVIATEWPEFAAIDWEQAKARMRRAVVVDGRNLLDPKQMRALGFDYYCVGRS